MFDLFNENTEYHSEGTISGILDTTKTELGDLKDDILDGDWDSVKGKAGKAASTLGSVSSAMSKSRKHSIVSRSGESILQFPVYITDSNRATVAHLVSKLFERVYADFVQTAFANNPIVDEDTVNKLKFLQDFHTNIHESVNTLVNTFYEPIDEFDEIMQSSIHNAFNINENVSVEFNVVPTTNENMIAENARLLNDPLTGFTYLREDVQKETLKDTKIDRKIYSNKDLIDLAKNISTGLKDDDGNNYNLSKTELIKFIKPETRKEIEEELKKDNAKDKAARQAILNNTKSLKWADGLVYMKMSSTNTKEVIVNKPDEKPKGSRKELNNELPKILIKEADIKKTNGMLPYTIECTFIVNDANEKDSSGNKVRYKVKYLISIKTVLHLVSCKDLIDDLPELVNGNIKNLRKVKYKTGEMKLKDYLFDITNLRKDAAKNITPNKRWINTLKQLSNQSKAYNGNLVAYAKNSITGSKHPIPNATLILTSADVITLKDETGIDLNEVASVKRLASNMFLIAVGIIDAAAGTMKVLFPDKDNSWDVQSLATIEAEVAKTDNSNLMKELNKIVNR